jgi:hypothetical protein
LLSSSLSLSLRLKNSRISETCQATRSSQMFAI